MSTDQSSLESKSPELQLGQVLIQLKLVSLEKIAEALAQQKEMKARGQKVFRLGEILLFMKAISVAQLHTALRHQHRKDHEVAKMVQQMKKERDELKRLERERLKNADDENTISKKISTGFRNLFKKKS